MPEMVRCDPQTEHGNGNPLLNEMEEMVQASSSSFEAGLLTMAATSRHIAEGEKVSLSDQIQSASTRASDSHASPDTPVKTPNPER